MDMNRRTFLSMVGAGIALGKSGAGLSLGNAGGKIIDNGDEGFSQSGLVRKADPNAYGGYAAFAAQPTAGDGARYVPGLKGRYDVYLHWGDYDRMDPDVRWTVRHAAGATTHSFSQRHNPCWHFHGTYELDAESLISLDGRKRADGGMVADAVKLVPSVPRVVTRAARDTITPVRLNYGDELHFRLRNGRVRRIKLAHTTASAVRRDGKGLVREYKFSADLVIDGRRYTLGRSVPTQESFHEPLEVGGMRVWLDAVSDIFVDDGGFMREKDLGVGTTCRPKRKARIVVNDVHDRICPEKLAWWYPEKADYIDVSRCYRGEDTWMGPYAGKRAHGGLDINMKSGTPLFAPIDLDDHYLFDSLENGNNNNRWRGIRRWDNGAIWWLQAHHLNKMVVPEHEPLKRGQKYAETAGVHIGAHEHTHFVFRIFEQGESYWIDPWLLFWQMLRDK